jgi:DNA polymerase-3 subunit epsilon/CBS domain-containing protein
MLSPPSHTPLIALPAVAFDLETTGLDPRRDRIVQVAAIAMLGPRMLDAPRIDRLIDPGIPIPESATRIHGLGDTDVTGAPKFAAMATTLHEVLSGRVVVGHHVAFDLAVLRHEAARAGLQWPNPPFLDLGLLVGALDPWRHDLSLEAVTNLLGVTIERRHSAIGDALAAAEAFARLIPRLRDADIRTLGEAQVLASRRADLALRQAGAGWNATSGEEAACAGLPAPARIDSYVFERRLQDVMSTPAVTITIDATLREAAQLMVAKRIGALLIGVPGDPPAGILTERDLLRAIAQSSTDPAVATVGQFMSTPVEVMGADEMLYRALGRMDRKGIRHLCVAGAAGAAAGMVSQRDLLRHRARSVHSLEDAIATADTIPALAAAYATIPDTAARLIAEGVNGVTLAQVVSNELRALTARAAQIASSRLSAARGEAPAPWCFLVLGSAGRGESLLAADQDNALIHAGRPDDDGWFAELGGIVSDILDEAGVPRCKGGVMAANSEWRGNLEVWRERVGRWLSRARAADLLNVDIFFDLAPVAGDATLARMLHGDAVHAASRTPPFIALLAESVAGLAPPLGLFGRLRTDAGRVDLKLGGLLPIVSVARTLALRIGSTSLSTPDRLRDATAAARLSEGDLSVLLEIHADLMTLIVRQQIEDLARGMRPSSRIAVKGLGRETVKRLGRELRILGGILESLRGAVSG